ncbi:unnamed protein product [Sphagnum balticum]
MNLVYWLSKYSGNTHERRAVYRSLAAIVLGGLGAVQIVIRLESSFTFSHSANALRQRRLSRTEISIKKQESKQARKREALVKGTSGRQEKKKRRNYVSKPFRAPLLAQWGLDGTELDRYHLP